MYEKLEKQSLYPFWDRPRILLIRHSFSNSEVLGLLCDVIVVNVEYRMLRQFGQPSQHKNFARTKRGKYERTKTVAEFLDTVGCDDCSGLFQ